MKTEEEIFESATRPLGDLAGVFEFDGETSYFYLYRTTGQGNKVLDSIHIFSDVPDFSAPDIEIKWTSDGARVGLIIRGQLWAIFDTEKGLKHGGNYRPRSRPNLDIRATEGF